MDLERLVVESALDVSIAQSQYRGEAVSRIRLVHRTKIPDLARGDMGGGQLHRTQPFTLHRGDGVEEPFEASPCFVIGSKRTLVFRAKKVSIAQTHVAGGEQILTARVLWRPRRTPGENPLGVQCGLLR